MLRSLGKLKNTLFVFICLIFLMSSCSSVLDTNVNYNVPFLNNTSYTLSISDSYGNDFSSFNIAPGEYKVIKSKSSFVVFNIKGSTGNHVIDYVRVGNEIRLYQYEYTVEYKISGTTSTVDVTLNNSMGGTEQYNNVMLPKIYSYKHFNDNFLYISAQNNENAGSVIVEIYYKGSLFKASKSEGAYTIATASGSKS